VLAFNQFIVEVSIAKAEVTSHLIKAIPRCGFDEGLNKISDHLQFSDCRCSKENDYE